MALAQGDGGFGFPRLGGDVEISEAVNLNPATLALADLPRNVMLTVGLSSSGDPISSAQVNLQDDAGEGVGPVELSLQSGTRTDGIWTAEFTLLEGLPEGSYQVILIALSGLAGVSFLETGANLEIGGGGSGGESPMAEVVSVDLSPPFFPAGSQPTEVEVIARLLHPSSAIESLAFELRSVSGFPLGETDLERVSLTGGQSVWLGRFEFLPSVISLFAPDGVLDVRMLAFDDAGSELVLDPGVQYRMGGGGEQVRFQVDVSQAQDLGWFKPALGIGLGEGMGMLVQILDGPDQGNLPLSSSFQPWVWSGSRGLEPGSAFSWIPVIDLNGDGVDSGDWIPGDTLVSSPHRFSVDPSNTVIDPVAFTSKEVSFFDGEPWALTGRALWNLQGDFVSFSEEQQDTYWDLSLASDADPTFVTVVRHNTDWIENRLPSEVSSHLPGMIWEVVHSTALANSPLATVRFDLSNLPGIVEIESLRLLAFDSFDSAGTLIDPPTVMSGRALEFELLADYRAIGLVSMTAVNFSSPDLPTIPEMPFPVDGNRDVDTSFSLSWEGGDAERWDVFIWAENALEPTFPEAEGLANPRYSLDLVGDLEPGQEYLWKVLAHNNVGSVEGPVWRFTVAQEPELVIEAVQIASSLVPGQSLDLSWQIRNVGGEFPASANLRQEVYLSASVIPEEGHLIGSVLYAGGTIPSGGSYLSSASFPTPRVGAGIWNVILLMTYGGVDEDRVLSIQPVNVSVSVLPDIHLDAVVAPSITTAGQTIEVQVDLSNQGGHPTGSEPWAVDLFWSESPEPLMENQAADQRVLVFESIAPGESLTLFADLWLDPLMEGTLYLHAVADFDNVLFDLALENNRLASSAIQVLPPTPIDLEPSRLDFSPVGVRAGEFATIEWAVVNKGPGDSAIAGWNDGLYLSQDLRWDEETDILLSSKTIWRLPELGEDYEEIQAVRIPEGLEGNWNIILVVDSANTLNEAVFENNNILVSASPLSVQPGIYPDFVVEAANTPSEWREGETVFVNWTVRNVGDGTAFPSWLETLYFSRQFSDPADAQASGDWVEMVQLSGRQSLVPQGAVERQVPILVDERFSSGGYVFVVVNDQQLVYEVPANQGNTSQALGVSYVEHPGSDLEVAWHTDPVFEAESRLLSLEWNTINRGATTLNSEWRESVYLSRDNRFDATGDLRLAEVHHRQALAGNMVEMTSRSLRVPPSWAGEFYVIVVVDDVEALRDTDRTNNVVVSAQRIESPEENLPQLRIGEASYQVSAGNEEVSLDWQVENQGGRLATRDSWFETWFLSSDPVIDPFDLVLHRTRSEGPVAAGEPLAHTSTVPLPSLYAGSAYLILVIDEEDEIHASASRSARVQALEITLPSNQEIDLGLSSVQLSKTRLEPGESLRLFGHIQNVSDTDVETLVTGVLYLSSHPDGEVREQVLGQVVQWVNLSEGAEAAFVGLDGSRGWAFEIPSLAPGEQNAFLALDSGAWLTDLNRANNLVALSPALEVVVPELIPGVLQDAVLEQGRLHSFYWSQPEAVDSLVLEIETPIGDGVVNASVFLDAPAGRGHLVRSETVVLGQPLSIQVEPALDGDYFIQVRSTLNDLSNGASVPATLLVEALDFGISDLAPRSGGNGGRVTVEIQGTAFRAPMSASLVGEGKEISADRIWPSANGVLYATFDLQEAPVGSYDLRVGRSTHEYGVAVVGDEVEIYSEAPEQLAIMSGAFEIEASRGLDPVLSLDLPEVIAREQEFTVVLEAKNVGNEDLEAPLVWLFGDPGFWKRTAGADDFQAGSLLLLLSSSEGPGGILRPGTTVRHQVHGRFVAPPRPGRQLGIGLVPAGESGIPFEAEDWLLEDPEAEAPFLAARSSLVSQTTDWTAFQSLCNRQLNRAFQGLGPETQVWPPRNLAALALEELAREEPQPEVPAAIELASLEPSVDFGQRNGLRRFEASADVDTDGDGLSDAAESELGTNPKRADSDRDGIPDGAEVEMKLDPKNRADGSADPDGDGLGNFDEYQEGTDPFLRDSDFDGENDREEYCGAGRILKNESLLGSTAFAFGKASFRHDNSMAATHLRHFLSGKGTDISYGPTSTAAVDMRRHSSAETPYASPVQHATPVAQDVVQKTLSGIDWSNPPTEIPEFSLNKPIQAKLGRHYNTLMKPNFYIKEKAEIASPPAFDLAFGIGGTQKIDTRLEVVRLRLVVRPTCESIGLAYWHGNLHFKISDHYEFDKQDAGIGPFDAAGRQLQVCGIAKPFWVHVNMKEPVRGQIWIPPLKGERCEPKDEPRPALPWDFPYDIVDVPESLDPNDILGPSGVGEDRFVSATTRLDYRIRFENDPTLATAPAQTVAIDFPVDPGLDLRTLRFHSIGAGNQTWEFREAPALVDESVDLGPESNLNLRVFAGVDYTARRALWRLESLDKQTLRAPTNPLVGFLPVNGDQHEGEGFVTFSVEPLAGVETGERIAAAASIVFDRNPAIATPDIFNTIDSGAPQSSLSIVEGADPGDFTLQWSGEDDQGGSGVENFDLLFREASGSWQALLTATTETNLSMPVNPATVPEFQILARDRVGNVQSRETAPVLIPFKGPDVSAFEQWSKDLLPDGERGFDDDPDGDGLSNGAEFYAGLNPSEFNRQRPFQWKVMPGQQGLETELVFVRARHAEDTEIEFEASSDLSDWESVEPVSLSVETVPEETADLVRIRFEPKMDSEWFLRFRFLEP